MADHAVCERIRMCLVDVGLDRERMMCSDEGTCLVGFGLGNEGRPMAEVERLLDQAIALANVPHTGGSGGDR